jgi:hypothetical protein
VDAESDAMGNAGCLGRQMKLVLFSVKDFLGVTEYRYAIHFVKITLLAQMSVDAMGNICDQPRGGLFGWRRGKDELEPSCGLLLIAAVQSDDMQMNIEIASTPKARRLGSAAASFTPSSIHCAEQRGNCPERRAHITF